MNLREFQLTNPETKPIGFLMCISIPTLWFIATGGIEITLVTGAGYLKPFYFNNMRWVSPSESDFFGVCLRN